MTEAGSVLHRVSGRNRYLKVNRELGEEGADPHDVDVLVIGDLDRVTVYEAAARATELLGRETSIRAVSHESWDASTDLFLTTVKECPRVEIPLRGASS